MKNIKQFPETIFNHRKDGTIFVKTSDLAWSKETYVGVFQVNSEMFSLFSDKQNRLVYVSDTKEILIEFDHC